MGFLGLDMDVGEYVAALNKYGSLLQSLQAGPTTRDFQGIEEQREGLEIALRALGGLLAGGRWNVDRLQDLLLKSEEGSPQYELYSILLGKQFSGQIEQHAQRIQQLEKELRSRRDEYEKKIRYEYDKNDKEEKKLNNIIFRQRNEIIALKRQRDDLLRRLGQK
jgi:hypothetical protein